MSFLHGEGGGKKKINKRGNGIFKIFLIVVPCLQLIEIEAVHGTKEGEVRTPPPCGRAHLVVTSPETTFLPEAEKMENKVTR